MFSGIIQAIGSIKSRQPIGRDLTLEINAPGLGLDQVAIGDSIAVDGVCLTATTVNEHSFVADLSTETLACSSLGRKRAGAPVNLEKALCLGDALGGHLVSGHVDAVGKLLGRRDDARSVVMTFSLPESVARFVAAKGSICIDGVSLTVNRVTDDSFTINVVPHTLEATTMGRYRGGTEVNLEVDLVARYIDRLMGGERGI